MVQYEIALPMKSEEVKDFCKVLNLILKWDSTRKDKTPYTPSDFLEWKC